MNILGINYLYHDSAAALVMDGELIGMVEEERLSRQKHTSVFPVKAIDWVLEEGGITFKDVDVVVYSADPKHKASRKLFHTLKNLPKSQRFLARDIYYTMEKEKGRMLWQHQMEHYFGRMPKTHFVQHHLAHAASSFFVSDYEEAAILTIDGSGEWTTTMICQGEGNRIKVLNETSYPHSLGVFYETVTQFIGFKPNYDEGKTMGLAPYGDPEVFTEKFRDVVNTKKFPDIELNLDYFQFQYGAAVTYSKKFEEVFGKPRHPKDEMTHHYENVARGAQEVLEEACLGLARYVREKTGSPNLVMAGGVALNSVMNGKIIQQGIFDKVFVNPASHDAGTAIGGAYWYEHQIMNKPRKFVMSNPYWGPVYSDDDMLQALKYSKAKYEYCPNEIIERTAEALHKGKIVGWYQGRSEMGPRALGNRSILGNPTLPDMKEILNREVKHREPFRPFAPSVAAEAQGDIFECDYPAPYMLFVYDIREEWRKRLPSVTHVDGSGRLQTISREFNEKYYDLIRAFEKHSGVPVIINTSFNIMGEPIVETPQDAIRCYFSTGIDVLVLGDYYLEK